MSDLAVMFTGLFTEVNMRASCISLKLAFLTTVFYLFSSIEANKS